MIKVSPIPGTTRDVVESAINIDGYPIVLSDTAGLRKTDDLIEKEGVKRALERYVHFLIVFGKLIFSILIFQTILKE